ncbi:MAG: energy-coupling factor transporter transmembrane protein EcfT [Clostridiales bacterium]|jgi:energy-coupling factor transport system permease protein|nr:energy-coupling factor transporter transmembrane protein EcfT [Clostridiales bacterium]
MRDRDAFSSYHPAVNMLYFALVLCFSMFFLHPVCLGISLVCASVYALYLNGKKALKFGVIYLLPMMLITVLLNPVYNHEGSTVLTYFPDGNPLTLESIWYGIAAAITMGSVIAWFSCYNEVMTSDKFVYLFGRVIPALSLILSMSLRMVPRFTARLRVIAEAQRCVGRDVSRGGLLTRARHGIRILSVMVTWALENAVETADSMKSRGYGLKGRTAFSIYHIDRRDWYALSYLAVCGALILGGAAVGGLYFRYFPTVKGVGSGALSVSLYAVYAALCVMPVIINLREDLKWRVIRSKI